MSRQSFPRNRAGALLVGTTNGLTLGVCLPRLPELVAAIGVGVATFALAATALTIWASEYAAREEPTP